MSEAVLEATGLRKVYGEHVAVDDVDLHVPAGGSLAIVGESGSGKTTVAKMLVGLVRPTAGTIRACGRDRSLPARFGARAASPRQRGPDRLPGSVLAVLDPRQIGRADDRRGAAHAPRRRHRRARAARIAELGELVGLDEPELRARPRDLSGGQRQRIAIARALAAEPRVLILDESVAALDVSIQAQVLNLLADIRAATGVSYVLISHDLAVVRQLTDDAIVMQHGRVVERGPTAAVLDDPQEAYTQLTARERPAPRLEARPALAHLPSHRRSSMTPLDLALVSGRVRTLDPDQPTATAIGISAGTIAVVGSDADVRARCDASTEVVELGGAAAVPGLIDSHIHPFLGADAARGVDLMEARTLEDVRGLVAAERARCAPDQWVLGYGLDYNAFTPTGIHGELIADAAGGGPALLTFIDMHTALATPRALELAGVDGPRSFVENAAVVLDAAGAPTGELHEMAAFELVRAAMPELSAAESYRLYADALRAYAATGLTGLHAMDGTLETLDLLRELEANGDLVTRVLTPFWIKPGMSEQEWEAFAAQRDVHGRRWRAGVAKFFIDGVIDSGTGWLCEPDSEGEGRLPFWPDPARYRKAVRFFAERGFQCVTHACGDRGVREALNAYREAGAAPGIRHRIEHIETLQPEDLPRFAAEGVIASMQAQHMMEFLSDRSDNWSRRLGEERCDRAFPIRSLLESGAHVALGSDWPVARFDPREGLAATRLRRPPGALDRAPFDDQGLDGLAALRGYTADAAAAVGDAQLGMLRAGMWADVTVFAHDPADCPADELMANDVLLTVVDGEVVHDGR